jgi:hypothetical protein
MKIARALSSLLAGVFLVGALTASSGCVLGVRGEGTVAYDVDAEPPPPRHIVVDERPGYIWVDGNWYWDGGRWNWRDGYYEPQRDGYVYVQGNWGYEGGRHHWTPGHWDRGGAGYRPASDAFGGPRRDDRREDRREIRDDRREIRDDRREIRHDNGRRAPVKVRDHTH